MQSRGDSETNTLKLNIFIEFIALVTSNNMITKLKIALFLLQRIKSTKPTFVIKPVVCRRCTHLG